MQIFPYGQETIPTAPRKPRADAQRNRERILEIAKQAFTRSGANISLDDVAKQAGVGAGTLYRHFPTRDALLEAVYRTEVEKLAAAEREFAEDYASDRGVAGLDVALRRLHRGEADHRSGAEYAGRRAPKFLKLPALRSRERFTRWWSARSRAATYVRTSTRSICCALWSASPMWRPARLAAKCQETRGDPYHGSRPVT